MQVGRRRFLAGSAAALATVAWPQRGRAAPERVDVAIVGAGLSGLNAARMLTELGANVVVLEAERRPGGRCRTADGWLHAPDLGGVQVGPGYARVRDTCARLGVALAPGAHVNAPYSYVLDGRLVPAKAWPDSPLNRLAGPERRVPPHAMSAFYVEQRVPFTRLDEWLEPGAAQYDISLAEWLTRQGASDEARRLIRATQGGVPLENLALLRMLQEAARSKVDVERLKQESAGTGQDIYQRFALASSHVVGGTSRLIEAMVKSLGDRVRLGREVRAIEMDRDGCVVRCADGSTVRARHALAAVPFSVLRRIAIRPALRGDQADAVARMPYGNQSQVWLHVKRPYWEKDGVEASMWTDGPFTLIRQQIESDGSRELLSVLSFGPNSTKIDAMPEADRARFAIAEIERIRPSTKGLLEVVGVHSWELAPFERGCSHQYVPGRVVAWSKAGAQPHGRLHFAGEHLRRLEVGMEAAMESGERAALEIAEGLDA